MILALCALLACTPHVEPSEGKTAYLEDTAQEDTALRDTAGGDTAEPIDTGPCPREYVELDLPAACDGHGTRAAATYPLSEAALRVSLPQYSLRPHLQLAPDLGNDGSPDLIITPDWEISDTFSVWILDASQLGEASTDDAWLSLHWSRIDYGYTLAAATYAPQFFPEDALVVKVGESPTSWYTFRAPLVPGLELEDADLVIVGRVSGRVDAANGRDVVPARDLDGDGLAEMLVPAPLAGDTTWGGTYEVGAGRVYVVPGGASGVLQLDDVTDWVGGAGFAECESWDISTAEPIGDVDGDGYDDLVVAGLSSLPHFGGDNAAWVVHGPFSGAKTVSDAVARIDGVSFHGRELESGDFDGDGQPDLALTERTPFIDLGADGVLDAADDAEVAAWVHYGPFEGVRQARDGVGLLPTIEGGYAGEWMEADDVDGDGIDDLLSIGHASDLALTWGPFCQTGAVTRGGLAFETEPEYPTPFAGITIGADVNNDELPDLAVRTYSDAGLSAVYIVLSSELPAGEHVP